MSRFLNLFSINQRVTGGPVLLLLILSLVLGLDRYLKQYDMTVENTIELTRVGAQPILNLMKSAVGGGNYAMVQDGEAMKLYEANDKLLFFSVEGKTDERKERFSVIYDAERSKVYRTEFEKGLEDSLKEKISSAEERLAKLPADHPNHPRIAKLLEKFKGKLGDYQGQRKEVDEVIKKYPLPRANLFEDGVYLDSSKWLLYMKIPVGNSGGGVISMVTDASGISDLGRATLMEVIPVNLATLLIGMVIAWALSKTITRPINTMQSTIMEIEKESDLSMRIDIHSNDEVGRTAAAFNSMLENFQGVIREVADYTERLALNAESSAEVSKRAASGAEQQKAETSRLASAISQMTSAIKEVASNASKAEDAAKNASREADDGRNVVMGTVESINNLARQVENVGEAVSKLEKGSKDVGMVVEVINEIAFQTNLLALNASVEAARAGRHGKGFAVVAEEVRSLAQRTQKSTQQISEIVEKLQKEAAEAADITKAGGAQAQDSVKQAMEAGKSLESITDAVGTITEMNIHIANSSEEQSAVSNEISGNVEIISKVADENASGADKVSTASDELTELTSRLEALIARFKV